MSVIMHPAVHFETTNPAGRNALTPKERWAFSQCITDGRLPFTLDEWNSTTDQQRAAWRKETDIQACLKYEADRCAKMRCANG